ncbi:MAG: acyl-CoA synthetase, partial [Acidimicrobiia bacterium]|nr:acyl-CoA synthetase [Acidimicrobiia bacterium]
FAVGERVRVLTDDGRDVAPGSGEVGLVAVSGRIPLGYHGDPETTAATFRTVGGVRYSVPGDHATVEADGSIRLLGRGSACINTGGEKVYPEEVELALRSHPGVFDCLVVGIPDDRFGEKVVALVQPRETGGVRGAGGAHGDPEPGEEALRRWCRERLAGYKVPRRMLYVDSLGRSAAGKADYNRLRALAAELDER